MMRCNQLSVEKISTHEWNVELPRFNTTEIADTTGIRMFLILFKFVCIVICICLIEMR